MNLKGLKYGFLEVISRNREDKRIGIYWLCKCHCPECTKRRNKKLISVRQDKLLEERTLSCGYNKDLQQTRGNFNTNTFVSENGYYVGYTYKGDKYYFDKEDFGIVTEVSTSWFINDAGYVCARDMRENAKRYKDGRRQNVKLKDVLMNKKPGEKVVYVNPNMKYDNRKNNLKKIA